MPSRRILVVEDQEDSRESLYELLTLWGHQVEVASTGEEGVEIARQQQPEIVLLDIGLPGGMDGHEVARRLRSAPGGGRLLIVALSGYATAADVRNARAAGCDFHLAKPCDLDRLAELIDGEEQRTRLPAASAPPRTPAKATPRAS